MSSVADYRLSHLLGLAVLAWAGFTGPVRSALADDQRGRPVVVGAEFTLDSAVYDSARSTQMWRHSYSG